MPGRKSILIVEDEPEVAEMLQLALQRVGYKVDVAPDGKAALQAVHDKIYDAAILDFALPDMNGLAVHREIRQMDEELARNTLFCSGHEQSDQNLGYYSTYGVGFLSKPFEIQEVIDSLESLWTADERT